MNTGWSKILVKIRRESSVLREVSDGKKTRHQLRERNDLKKGAL